MFRAGAAAQVIRDRGGADDEELIVQQLLQQRQATAVLVALAEASAFDFRCGLSCWRDCRENARSSISYERSRPQHCIACNRRQSQLT